jgi:cell division control protein 6
MSQQSSSADTPIELGNSTELLIKNAFTTSSSRQIVINPSFLDDEKLPEAERVTVLQEVFHRNIRIKQLERLARCLSPILGGELPSTLLIYGPSGTGKSVTSIHFLFTLKSMCVEKEVPFSYFYVDLTTPHTCFGAFNELAIALDPAIRRYRKGIALDEMQDTIIRALAGMEGFVCVLIDEADNVTRDGDLFMTFLAKTLPRKVPVRVFYIFLTNRVEWEKTLDPRILSVLKKVDLIFEPYDAADLLQILTLRVEKALDGTKVDEGAIRKIAAYASRETGDARKAVELLSKAAKVASETSGRLTEKEVDVAEHNLEVDKTEELIRSLAVQQRLALKSCYLGFIKQHGKLTTGNAFAWYQQICRNEGSRPLTQRRFGEVVSYLDVYGLINAPVISKGRYGKTRELSGSLPEHVIQNILNPS